MNKLNRMKKSILSIAFMVGTLMPFAAPLIGEGVNMSYASGGLGISNIPDMSFDTDGQGNVIIKGDSVSSDTNAALGKAVKFIKWIAAAGTILLLGVFIINLLKIGASGTNVQARAAAQQGLIWSGIATAAMSVASTIFFFLQGILV